MAITGRIRIQQRLSGNNQNMTILCKLRNQSRIRDNRTHDKRKNNTSRRNAQPAYYIMGRNGLGTTQTEGNI